MIEIDAQKAVRENDIRGALRVIGEYGSIHSKREGSFLNGEVPMKWINDLPRKVTKPPNALLILRKARAILQSRISKTWPYSKQGRKFFSLF